MDRERQMHHSMLHANEPDELPATRFGGSAALREVHLCLAGYPGEEATRTWRRAFAPGGQAALEVVDVAGWRSKQTC